MQKLARKVLICRQNHTSVATTRPELRIRPIQPVLRLLGDKGLLSAIDVAALTSAYRFLRLTENRLQAWQDRQTHVLPETPDARLRLARSMGFDGSATAGYVRIDRLITVDGAAGHFSSQMFRRIPPNVRRNLNLYQLHPSPIGSHGGPNEAHNRRATDVVNRDLSSLYTRNPGDAHSSIDEDTTLEVLETICSAIGCQALPRVLPQGLAVG